MLNQASRNSLRYCETEDTTVLRRLTGRRSLRRCASYLWRGDEPRKSRAHDLRGNRVGPKELCTELPRATVSALLRRTVGWRPTEPWIPYGATKVLSELAQPEWSVLEFGSGMSTLWWATRVAHVRSVEADPEWYAKISSCIRERGLGNVQLELRAGESYWDLNQIDDRSIDLLVVDGHARDRIVTEADRVTKRPGWVYLDDSDKSARWHEHWGEAVEALLNSAADNDGAVTFITGFKPATLVACEGMLVRYP